MKCVLVECYLDRYFIHKLLNDNSRIDKKTNKNNVLSTFIKDSDASRFLIGIVDYDNEDILQNRQLAKQNYGFELVSDFQKFKVYKGLNKPHYLFTLNPSAIEQWLIDILENELNSTLISFEINNLKDFQKLKTNSENLDIRIQNMIRDILANKINSPTLTSFEQKLSYLLANQFESEVNQLI